MGHRSRTLFGGWALIFVLAGCGAGADAGEATRGTLRGATVTSSAATSPAPTAAPTGTPSATATPVPPLTASPRPSRSPRAREPEPEFSWKVSKVSSDDLGKSWRTGCPVEPSALRSVSLNFWGFDQKLHTGVLVLHRDVVKKTRPVFKVMFEENFPLRSVRPVSEFGASDDASMAADNTSAFNCRRAVAAGPPSWSRHAYGKAIDVNPVENPYLFGKKVLPPGGKKFTDRSTARRGMIRRRDPIHQAFLEAGYRWGGQFSNPDYQHFDR